MQSTKLIVSISRNIHCIGKPWHFIFCLVVPGPWHLYQVFIKTAMLVYLCAPTTVGGSSSTGGVRNPTPPPRKLNRVLGSCAKSRCSNVAWNLSRFSVLQHMPKIHRNIHIQPSRCFSSLGKNKSIKLHPVPVLPLVWTKNNLKNNPPPHFLQSNL